MTKHHNLTNAIGILLKSRAVGRRKRRICEGFSHIFYGKNGQMGSRRRHRASVSPRLFQGGRPHRQGTAGQGHSGVTPRVIPGIYLCPGLIYSRDFSPHPALTRPGLELPPSPAPAPGWAGSEGRAAQAGLFITSEYRELSRDLPAAIA